MIKYVLYSFAAFCMASTASCTSGKIQDDEGKALGEREMIDSRGQKVGSVEIREVADGINLKVQLTNAEPGVKAIHIHERGVCETPNFETAGAHFNPTQKEHGRLNPKGKHLGDLPNIKINEDGSATYKVKVQNLSLKPEDTNSLAHPSGTALIIHKSKDDLKTNPSGNSGDRIYCAILTSEKTNF